MDRLNERFRAKLVARNLGTTKVTVYPASPVDRQRTAFELKLQSHYEQARKAEQARIAEARAALAGNPSASPAPDGDKPPENPGDKPSENKQQDQGKPRK